MPPLDADERTCLASWLDFYRATLVGKCDGLADDQLRAESATPSSMTLLGLLQHMAEVERNWFRRVLAQEDAPPIYTPGPKRSPHDGGFDLDEGSSYDRALRVWGEEVDVARRNCADRAIDASVAFMGGQVTLRWIYTHMIGEYARHCGHADLLRERIDGSTGV
ncbi:DinB family protein [Pseudonocardia spinosispora]|uniref:DinB family protein n=1 Tax=Pseudonocardia spinosispora TaxID=103441 RepID=UPI0005655D25|nr:DinB family protein [Pseudonocardia spinosispora]